MRYLLAIPFALLLAVQAQVMLPHRKGIQSPVLWNPSQISGLRYWWVASDLAADSTVTNWVDRIHGLPATNNANTGTNNSISGVRFSGSQQLILQTNLDWTLGSGTGTVWVVMKPDILYIGTNGILGTATTNQLAGFGATGGNALGWPAWTNYSMVFGPYMQDFAVVCREGSTNDFWVNGIQRGPNLPSYSAIDTFGRIGQYSTPGTGFNGYIQEILLSSWALSASDLTNLHAYVMRTYTNTWTSPTNVSSLTNSLICYWTMDETSGNRADAITGQTLTDSGSTSYRGGVMTNAALFGGTTSLYHASSTNLQTGPVDFTFSVWVYNDRTTPPSSPHNYTILGKDGSTSGYREYTISLDVSSASDYPSFDVYTATDTAVPVRLSSKLQSLVGLVGRYHHFICWHSTADKKIYMQIDGGDVQSATYTGNLQAASSANFRVGARDYTSYEDRLYGDVDEVRFWKRVLTEDERKGLYNNGYVINQPLP